MGRKKPRKSNSEVYLWLKDLKLKQYLDVLEDNGIAELQQVKNLQKPVLSRMGIESKHARLMINSAREMFPHSDTDDDVTCQRNSKQETRISVDSSNDDRPTDTETTEGGSEDTISKDSQMNVVTTGPKKAPPDEFKEKEHIIDVCGIEDDSIERKKGEGRKDTEDAKWRSSEGGGESEAEVEHEEEGMNKDESKSGVEIVDMRKEAEEEVAMSPDVYVRSFLESINMQIYADTFLSEGFDTLEAISLVRVAKYANCL